MQGATEAPPPGQAPSLAHQTSPPTAVLPSSTSSSGIQAAPPANISATASTSADVAAPRAAGQGSNLAFSRAAGSSPVALPPPHFAPPKAGEAMDLSSAEEDDDDEEASDASQGPSSSQRPLNGAKGALAAQYDSVNASPVPSSSRLTDEDSGTDDTGNAGSSVPSHRRKEVSAGSSLKHVHRQKKGLEEAEANPDLYGLRRSVSTVTYCQASMSEYGMSLIVAPPPSFLAIKGPSAKEGRE